MIGVFSSTYLGPIAWYSDLLKCEEIYIETQESWLKQTYRNRCYIDSPNGKLMLNIPVKHQGKSTMGEVEIAYNDSWSIKHWQAIKTTYATAPFFEVLAPDLKAILDRKYSRLYDLNLSLMRLILDWLNVEKPIYPTQEWSAQTSFKDYRSSHLPKKPIHLNSSEPYPQMFDHKNGFLENISILDLLFNEGPLAYGYLVENP